MPFIIITGLPGSGKTTLLNKIKSEYINGIFLDDDLGPANIGNLRKMGQNNMVIIAHPRFTNFNLFKSYMNILKNIDTVYVFENNPEACVLNVRRRCGEDPKNICNLLEIDIHNFSQNYNPENYVHNIQNFPSTTIWNYVLLPVYEQHN